MSNGKKSIKFSLSLFRPSCEHIKKSCHFLLKRKNSISLGISPASISSLSFVRSVSCCILSSFCFFISCFVSKSASSRIAGALGRVKIIYSSGTISSFGFSFSITLSSSPQPACDVLGTSPEGP